jgi:hypothetical protein
MDNEDHTMELSKQIFDLLEPDEKERVISQRNQERFEQQCGHFLNYVMVPAFKNMQGQFMSYGRSVDISPSFFACIRPGVYPKLCITVPDGRTFNYWVKITHAGGKFIIERFRSIEGEGGVPQVFKISLPQGRQLLDDLSEVNEEYIQRDIIELYQRHIIMNKSPLRHPQ